MMTPCIDAGTLPIPMANGMIQTIRLDWKLELNQSELQKCESLNGIMKPIVRIHQL